jgi:hypothetical protein
VGSSDPPSEEGQANIDPPQPNDPSENATINLCSVDEKGPSHDAKVSRRVVPLLSSEADDTPASNRKRPRDSGLDQLAGSLYALANAKKECTRIQATSKADKAVLQFIQNSKDMTSEDKFTFIKYINKCPWAASTYLLVDDDVKNHMIENALKTAYKD